MVQSNTIRVFIYSVCWYVIFLYEQLKSCLIGKDDDEEEFKMDKDNE